MIIANPIYDTVFKSIMENDRVAKFFIGTLLEQTIESIELKPQENISAIDIMGKAFGLYRLDFIATVKTETGEYKKIMIEIQKAKKITDLMRFRLYLAEQYKKDDFVNGEKFVFPITTIYILGFKLPGIDTPCLKVSRVYQDLINQTIITTKNDFVEKLTHDCFIVQATRVTNRFQTPLDKLLSVFEQDHFINEDNTIKEYYHTTNEEELKIMTGILHYSCIDPAERRKIEIEQEAFRTLNEALENNDKENLLQIQAKEKVIQEKEIVIQEKEIVIQKKEVVIQEKENVIQEKENVIQEKEIIIQEKESVIHEKDTIIEENRKAMLEKDKAMEEMAKKIQEYERNKNS